MDDMNLSLLHSKLFLKHQQRLEMEEKQSSMVSSISHDQLADSGQVTLSSFRFLSYKMDGMTVASS